MDESHVAISKCHRDIGRLLCELRQNGEMNFSTKSMLALTAWITLIVASVVKPDAKVFQDILQLAIYGSYLLAICIGMITSRRSVRDYCVGFVVVGLGLSLLTRYAAVNVEHITIALANVFGNHADSNFYDLFEIECSGPGRLFAFCGTHRWCVHSAIRSTTTGADERIASTSNGCQYRVKPVIHDNFKALA